MKKNYILTFVFIAFNFLMVASCFGSVMPDTLWSRTFGGELNDSGVSFELTSDGSFIMVGSTSSFGEYWDDLWLVKADAQGNELWSRAYGGSDYDYGRGVQETPDGGYIIVGDTYSFGPGLDDIWLIKTDADGNKLWEKFFGGNMVDSPLAIKLTPDGGYIILGYTESLGAGRFDFWLIKTDAEGNEIWDRTYGGLDDDWSNDILLTDDGGYILLGRTVSYGVGDTDIWLIKTDAEGNEIWDRTYGTSQYDYGESIKQTFDGGFIILGTIRANGIQRGDFWLIKTDAEGNEIWERTYGGNGEERGYSVEQTSDGGYVITGYTQEFVIGESDIVVIKTDSDGNVIWGRSVGGSKNDYGECVHQTPDGRIAVLSNTDSFGAGYGDLWLLEIDNPPSVFSLLSPEDGTAVNTIANDFSWEPAVDQEGDSIKYVLYIDSDPSFRHPIIIGGIEGTTYHYNNVLKDATDYYWKVHAKDKFGASSWSCDTNSFFTDVPAPDTAWTRIYGMGKDDYGHSIQQTSDGGYIIIGSTMSYGAGDTDFWLMKTDAEGNELWSKTYGGEEEDDGDSMQKTSDGGFILFGTTFSYGTGSGDYWLIKTDAEGNELWNRTYGGEGRDYGTVAMETSDGGYILAGSTLSFGAGGYDIWLIKTDSSGNVLWDRTYGGSAWDVLHSFQIASDGSFILFGRTCSYGAGDADFWLIKTDSEGNVLWDKTFGGPDEEWGEYVQETSDGGFILVGSVGSFGLGPIDLWLVRTDSEGNEIWDSNFGGYDLDKGYCVQQTSDGGFVMTGHTTSFGAGDFKMAVIKTDADGDIIWDKLLGGPGIDGGVCIRQTEDGNLIVLGDTSSFGTGNDDLWLVRLVY